MKVRKATASEVDETSSPSRPKFSTKRAHPTYAIEPCPNCQFPEADGGYCPECGWTRYCGCGFCENGPRSERGRKRKEAPGD